MDREECHELLRRCFVMAARPFGTPVSWPVGLRLDKR